VPRSDLLRLTLLLGWSCTPPPSLSLDSGEDTAVDTASGDTAVEEPEYFEPVLWQVHETMYLWEDGGFADFKLEPGGSPQTPFLTVRFMTQAYLESGSDEGFCDWTTELVLREENDRNDGSVWIGMQLEPSTLSTDCEGFDPEVWEGGNPRIHMETASLWFGIGPTLAFAAVLENLYEESGKEWIVDGEPYLFSLFFGLWDDENWGLVPTELNYATAYEVDSDGAIQWNGDGSASQLVVGDSPPEGVIRALPYRSPTMDELPP
jgi:hypothetical protein